MKNLKRVLAGCLSAGLVVMSMPVSVFAEDSTEGTAPIYSFDKLSVIVPTEFTTAINPDGLEVKVADGTSTEQVISKKYGIVNKSSKAKLVTVALKAEDLNTDKIDFKASEAEVTAAEKDSYAIYLAAVPADATGVSTLADGSTAIDKDTIAAALNDVTMTPSTTQKMALGTTESELGLYLGAATYEPIEGSEVTLGETENNDVTANYDITDIGGVSAFTFTGKANTNTNWTALPSGVKISAVYSFVTPDVVPEIVEGTNAMVELVKPVVEAAPEFSAGTTAGTISYTAGEGDLGLKSIDSVEVYNSANKGSFDGLKAYESWWADATVEDNIITFDTKFLAYYNPGATEKATITYTNNAGDTLTVEIDVVIPTGE